MARLNHPNVVTVYDVGEREGEPWMAMEFVEGQTLFAWRRGDTVPLGLSPGVSVLAATVLFGLLAWFAAELSGDSTRVGLAERFVAGAQSLWPLAVVLLLRRP